MILSRNPVTVKHRPHASYGDRLRGLESARTLLGATKLCAATKTLRGLVHRVGRMATSWRRALNPVLPLRVPPEPARLTADRLQDAVEVEVNALLLPPTTAPSRPLRHDFKFAERKDGLHDTTWQPFACRRDSSLALMATSLRRLSSSTRGGSCSREST